MSVKVDKTAKERIIDAALDLFYYQGFHQTSVRQIAGKANVNQALIAYYFGNKKGLLEQLMIEFYEGYFSVFDRLAEEFAAAKMRFSCKDRLVHSFQYCFDYLFNSYRMTRFIYRELSLDSTLIREVMTIYLAKEKYYFLTILEDGRKHGELLKQDLEMMVLQLLNVLYMPFLQPQMIREVYHVEPHSTEFKERYLQQCKRWIESF